MQLGELEFQVIDAGSATTPLVLEAPEPLHAPRFAAENAPAIGALWEQHPLFVVRNTVGACLGDNVGPNLSPYWHIDYLSDVPVHQWVGLMLSNPHEVNTRGTTDHLQAPAVIEILLRFKEELYAMFQNSKLSFLHEEDLRVLNDPDFQNRCYAASNIIHALQLFPEYCKQDLSLQIMGEINGLPYSSVDWIQHPHSTAFVSQRGFHRSGKTANLEGALELYRLRLKRANGVVRPAYRLPSSLISL